MSSIAMAADSTHADRRNKHKSYDNTSGKDYHKPASKSVRKYNKKEHIPSSSSSSSSSSDSSSGRQKHNSKRKLHRIEDDSCSDHDSDLDLSKDLLPIGGYVSAREKMVEHMFRSISMKKLKAMLPEILKTVDLLELKQLCVEQLEGMSKKRICRILDGDDAENISSSGTDEDDLDLSHNSEVCQTLDEHLSSDCTAPHQVATAEQIDSSNGSKPSCSESHEKLVETQSNKVKLIIEPGPAKCENTCQKTFKELTDCYLDSSSKIVENKAWKMSPSKNLLAVYSTKKPDEEELDYDAEDASSVHSYSSIPSLASEPEDKCLPFKLLKISGKTARNSSEENPALKQIRDIPAEVGMKQVECGTGDVECPSGAATATFKQQISPVVPTSPEPSSSSSVQYSATDNSQTSVYVAQARAENENNLNVEAEHGRNTTPTVRSSIDDAVAAPELVDTRENTRSGMLPMDSNAMTSDGESVISNVSATQSFNVTTEEVIPIAVDLSSVCCDAEDIIFNIEERDFSDDDIVGSVPQSSVLPSRSVVNKGSSKGDERRARVVRHEMTANDVDGRRSCDTSTNSARSGRRRSAEAAGSVNVSKVQRRSHPSGTSDVGVEKRTSKSSTESVSNVGNGISASGATSLVDSKASLQHTTVRKVKITRPIETSDGTARETAHRVENYSKSVELPVNSDLKDGHIKESKISHDVRSSKRLSPEALSKTQLEILELEMRARAIKAMLRAQEELEKKASSKSSLQQDTSRQRSERHEPYRGRVNMLQRGVALKPTLSLSARQNMLPPSPPGGPGRHRVLHRNRFAETIARQRQRQFVLKDRLTRFGTQMPVVRGSQTRLQLSGTSAGGRVATQRDSSSGSRIVRLSSQYVGLPAAATPLSNVYRGRRFNRQFKSTRAVPELSGVNRSDVRRVFVATQTKRLVKMTSGTTAERSVLVSSQSVKQTERKTR